MILYEGINVLEKEALGYVTSLLNNQPMLVTPKQEERIAVGLGSVCTDIINASRKEMEEMKQSYEFDSGILSVLQEQKAQLEGANASLNERIAAGETEINELEVKKALLLTEFEGIRKELAELKKRMAATTEESQKFDKEKESLASEITRMHKEREELLERVTSLRQEEENIASQLEASGKNLANLQDELNTVTVALKKAESGIDRLTSRISSRKVTVIWKKVERFRDDDEVFRLSFSDFHSYMRQHVSKYAAIMGVSYGEALREFEVRSPILFEGDSSNFAKKLLQAIVYVPTYIEEEKAVVGDINISLNNNDTFSLGKIAELKGQVVQAQVEAETWKAFALTLLKKAYASGANDVADMVCAQFGLRKEEISTSESRKSLCIPTEIRE